MKCEHLKSHELQHALLYLEFVEIPILMYHYVRPSTMRFSERHNVLDLGKFQSQLKFICERFEFITGNNFTESSNDKRLQPKSIWLTFDDGYKDCIRYVLPELLKVDARATFYIPTEAIFGRKLLDVNKVHILLSGSKSPKEIVKFCADAFNELEFHFFLDASFDDLFLRYGIANPWNDAETEFLKKLFQKVLPTNLRKQLLDTVFSQLVARSESSWVDECYLTPDDVFRLHECGMEIGSHGHSHDWLENLDFSQQSTNILESFRLIESKIGVQTSRTLSYPYGSYNAETLRIISNLSVNTAVIFNGNKLAVVDLSAEKYLELDRIDVMFFDEFARGGFV